MPQALGSADWALTSELHMGCEGSYVAPLGLALLICKTGLQRPSLDTVTDTDRPESGLSQGLGAIKGVCVASADPRAEAREDVAWGCPWAACSPSWQPSGVVVTMAIVKEKQAQRGRVGREADGEGRHLAPGPRRQPASLGSTACVQHRGSGKGPRPLHQAGGPSDPGSPAPPAWTSHWG